MSASVQSQSLEESRQHGALSAFKYRNFRLYFIGQLVSTSGTWMQSVAQGWLVFNLTKSESWLGVVACAAGLPSLFLSPFAGVFVERLPRHRILMLTQTLQMMLAFILAGLTFAGVVQVWHIVALSFALGTINAIDAPTRQAFIVEMVGREDLPSGISLSATMFNASRVFGPTAAGIALVQFGPAWCFLINGLSFTAVLFSLFMMQIEKSKRKVGSFSPIEDLRRGLSFSAQHPVIAPVLLLAICGSVFGFNVWTLLPAFADTVLKSPDVGYAALSAANGIGAVLAALLVTRLARRFGRGRLLTTVALFAPFVLLAMALTTSLPVALVITCIAGFSLILQFVSMNTAIQTVVEDAFRGRVMSLYTLTFFGIAPFGALALGVLAERITTSGAIAFCGLVSLALNSLIVSRAKALRQLK